MTCVVGLVSDDGLYMGADSAWGSTDWHEYIKEGKLFRRGDYLIGCAGSARQAQLLRYSLQIPQFSNGAFHKFMVVTFAKALRDCLDEGGILHKKDGVDSTAGPVLIGHNKHLYYIGYDLQITEARDPYMVIGCGRDWALGSLCSTDGQPPQDRVLLALKAAAKYSGGVAPPFTQRKL